ncbi:MAG: hypothetical protein WKF89_03395 [Chitinophagaceae bacterium]
MNEKMDCTLYYNKKTATLHLKQIFTGFFELERKGFLHLKLEHRDWLPENYTENLLLAVINNKYKVLYDVNDGFNWLWTNTEKNLQFFKETLSEKADFYFKRSFNNELLKYVPDGNSCKYYPLGLNYIVSSKSNRMESKQFDFKSWAKYQIKSNKVFARMLKAEDLSLYDLSNYEYFPISQNKEPKILFLTRVWDPGQIQKDKMEDNELYVNNVRDLNEINEARVQTILECRKLFGKQFTGGLSRDKLSLEKYPELIVPPEMTHRKNYLSLVKQSDICIATTGLHKSIGWKFAEYIAAARGIISEKLHYELPGNISSPTNYLEFSTVRDLLNNISLLLNNPETLRKMMLDNYQYYNLYVKPENIVLNSLLTVRANT